MPRPGLAPRDRAGGEVAEREEAPLPAGAEIDPASVREEIGSDRALDELDHLLVGLAPVKARLREIEALLLVDRLRENYGLRTARPNLHMCFAGPPGTGKTTVATKMAEVLHALGYLPSAHLVTVTREDLVGQYVGHTAPKTKEVFKRAMGGVLFIDEAYSLHRPDNERDYGSEAIEMLLQAMEEHRDRLVVVLAGYRDRMDQFFTLNPGLRSRIAHHLDFTEFDVDELVEIGHRMLDEQGYQLSKSAEQTFRSYVERRRAQPHFANARSIRNAIERARLRHAARLISSGKPIGRDALCTLEADDLLVSRVFSEEPSSAATSAASAASAADGP